MFELFCAIAGFFLVSNHLQLFRSPSCYPNRGHIVLPPTTIAPGSKETMVARKASWCHTGSSGTVAWEIDGAEQSLVLLWSIPFNNTYYANWLGAGITEPKHHFKADSSSFESLYYNPIKAENLK